MNKFFVLVLMALSFSVLAQQNEIEPTRDNLVADEPTAENKPITNKPGAAGEANINLRTTVTGNQEQPRVMYILPWQSPLSPELEMEMLGSETDAVFGHLERDELQRQLEAAGELDAAE